MEVDKQRVPPSRAVSLRRVTKVFSGKKRQTVAVKEFSMDVDQGEFSVILGPSGCGKSTVIRMIAGLEIPTAGTVQINGWPVTSARNDCSMVFQSYTSFPWLSVLDNIAFGLSYKPEYSPAQRLTIAHNYARLVGLEAFIDSQISELSGGMKQRVAIASALATDPRILLMDEPFGALDSQTRMVMQELLLRIVEESDVLGTKSKTVVFVTHDIEEALLLGDRLYICTARPAQIRAEIEIPFPHPRNAALRTRPRFIELRHEVFNLLREATIQQELDRHYASRGKIR